MGTPDALFAELESMLPQGREPFFAHYARDLIEDDLILGNALPKREAQGVQKLKNIRSSHHEAARLVALGKEPSEIALITGYTPVRVCQLKNDPAFQELVANYRGQVEGLYVDVHKRLAGFTNDAMEVLHERLLDAPEKIKTSDLKDLLALGLDRTGFGPKSTVNTNIKAVVITNAELERIKGEAAAARLGTVRQLEAPRPSSDPGSDLRRTRDFDSLPFPRPKRLRGSKARGMTYERKFQRMVSSSLPSIAQWHHNQWIEFEDTIGHGFAQPDSYLVLKSRIICFECKLTETLSGYSQLSGLYAPLLREIYSRPIILILACKNLSRLDLRRLEVSSLREALFAPSGRIATYQWLP